MGRPFLVNIIIWDYGSIPGTVSKAFQGMKNFALCMSQLHLMENDST